MLAKTFGGAVHGVDAQTIVIEVNVTQGQKFYISGLPDGAVKESQHRVESSLKSLNYHMPRTKVVVNLAPADIRKEGSAYDLPIGLGILKASHQIEANRLEEYMIMGELALDGTLRPIRGVLPIAIHAKQEKCKAFMLPKENAREASVVDGLDVIGVESLQEAIGFLEGKITIHPLRTDVTKVFQNSSSVYDNDFCDVQGQENIKRALEIAAAGGHNVIMIGPPGSGKTMLAKRLPSILPPFTLDEALETTKIHSIVGKTGKDMALITTRPFRAPHHTVSDVALVGGGGNPRPGEISLAHNGVLFLDELPEFKRTVLEVMRQPMEARRVTISRANVSVDYPANFMLIASMNPCPCGYYNHPEKKCICAPGVVQRYMSKISGPLLDRIDLHVEVTPVSFDKMTTDSTSENSETIRKRVTGAREIQYRRFLSDSHVHCNAMISSRAVRKICSITHSGSVLLKTAMDRLKLSARAYDRILKVSRTIADLAGSDTLHDEHLAEAIQYRSLDREDWAG